MTIVQSSPTLGTSREGRFFGKENDAGQREGSRERGDQTGDGWYPQKKPQAESPGAEQGREDRTRGTSLVHGVTRSRSRLITV